MIRRDNNKNKKPFWRPKVITKSKTAGVLSLFLGLISLGLCLFLDILLFGIATNPLVSSSFVDIDERIFSSFFAYTAFVVVFGILLALSAYIYRLVLRYKGVGFLLIIIPSVVAFLVLMASGLTENPDHFRIFLKIALMPLIGFSILLYAFSASYVASQAISKTSNGKSFIRKMSIIQIILTLWLAIPLDWHLMDNKVAGAFILFPTLLILGLLFIIEAAYIFSICSIHTTEIKEVENGSGMKKKILYKKARNEQGRRNRTIFTIIGIVTGIIFLVFIPPLNLVVEGPKLDIHKAEGDFIITGSGSHRRVEGLILDVKIINNGGIGAAGNIEILIYNATFNQTVDSIDSLDGFGFWRIETEIIFGTTWNLSKKEHPRLDYRVRLIHNGKIVVDKEVVQIPNPCTIGAIIITFVIVAIWRSKHKRRRL